MSAHPAYPTERDAAVERRAEDLAFGDQLAAELLAQALRHAYRVAASLRFKFGSPVPGYDMADILAALREMTPPCDQEYMRRLRAQAFDAAREAQADADRGAAEYRGRVARETAP